MWRCNAALLELQAEYVQAGRAFRLVEAVNGWSFVTDPAAALWVRQLYPEAKPTRLTGPQTGNAGDHCVSAAGDACGDGGGARVSVDGVMQVLLDRSLVKIAGRAEVPGRPLLTPTTEYFCSTSA